MNKPILLGGMAAAIVVSGGILAWGLSQSNKPAIGQTTPSPSATTAPVRQISALGRVQPAGEIVKLAAPLALDGDRIKEIRVKEGDRVIAGQIVAVLDAVDRLQARLVQAQQQVAVAESKLAQVKAGAKSGEIKSQQATIDRAVMQVRGEKLTQEQAIARIRAQWDGDRLAQQQAIARIQAQWDGDKTAQLAAIDRLNVERSNANSELNRYSQLSSQGAISQSVLDARKLAVASFNKQLAEQRAILARINNTSSRQLAEAQAILVRINSTNGKQLAEQQAILTRINTTGATQLTEGKANLDRITEIRPVDIQAARTEVQSAIASLKHAQTELDQSYIRAPFAGQILKLNAHKGEKIGANGVADFAETNNPIVVAEVYQTDIDRVKLGQHTIITSPALTGKLSGKVSHIGLQVSRQNVFSDRPGENLDRRVIEVKIALDPQDSQRVSGLSNLQVQVVIKN
jgi:HlyD family secretion protein